MSLFLVIEVGRIGLAAYGAATGRLHRMDSIIELDSTGRLNGVFFRHIR